MPNNTSKKLPSGGTAGPDAPCDSSHVYMPSVGCVAEPVARDYCAFVEAQIAKNEERRRVAVQGVLAAPPVSRQMGVPLRVR